MDNEVKWVDGTSGEYFTYNNQSHKPAEIQSEKSGTETHESTHARTYVQPTRSKKIWGMGSDQIKEDHYLFFPSSFTGWSSSRRSKPWTSRPARASSSSSSCASSYPAKRPQAQQYPAQ